jgi:ATP-dependent DNA helicase RecG
MNAFEANLNADMLQTLHGLIAKWESEIIEFKRAGNDFDSDRIGRYFSALSNEASLKGVQHGWLIFGVDDKTHSIVGSAYRNTHGLETLKYEIGQNTTGGITFTDIFEVYDDSLRVVMFKIPAAVIAMPTAWKNHWYGRNGESLVPLSIQEIERLRLQTRNDWSKQIIDGTNIDFIDLEAINIARKNYKNKQNRSHIVEEVDNFTDEQFLTKLKLLVNGKLTNAAIVLLGNQDYDRYLEPPARIMWRLFDIDGAVKDYEEFNIPFITVVDKIYSKIRNLNYRYMPNHVTLFPIEIQQYDQSLLRELLNNCIVHQDYTIGGRIYLDEHNDSIDITNPGTFLPGDVSEVLKPEYTAPYYRNQLLADAMVKLNMIDTVQMGIRKVFNIQRNRFFPLPDFDLRMPQKVAVKVYGKTLDENYTHLLFGNDELPISTVFLLDRIQKKLPLDRDQYKQLKKAGLIEGKIPNVYVSAKIAVIVGEKEKYIKNRALDDKYYIEMIINYLKQFGSGTRRDFINLLGNKLSDTLTQGQKVTKIRYLLSCLNKKGIIKLTTSNKRKSAWQLTEPQND